jgi:hypothetical protein
MGVAGAGAGAKMAGAALTAGAVGALLCMVYSPLVGGGQQKTRRKGRASRVVLFSVLGHQTPRHRAARIAVERHQVVEGVKVRSVVIGGVCR